MDQGEPLNVIQTIQAEESDEAYQVYVRGDGRLTYTAVKQPFPLGVILYFPDTQLGSSDLGIEDDHPLIQSVSVSQLEEGGDTSRLEILLREDTAYAVNEVDDGLQIAFAKSASGSGAGTTMAQTETAAMTEEPLDQTASSAMITKSGAAEAKSDATNPAVTPQKPMTTALVADTSDRGRVVSEPGPGTTAPAWLNRIDFASEENGRSTLLVGTTAPVQYDLQKVGPKRLSLKLTNTKVPKYRQRPIITTRFVSAVDRIIPYHLAKDNGTALVSIELREDVPYAVEQVDSLLLVHFEASQVAPRPLDAANLPNWRQALEGAPVAGPIAPTTIDAAPQTAAAPVGTAAAPVPEPPSGLIQTAQQYDFESVSLTTGRKQYTGEKIALDFYQTDIKNVFRILREVSGKNFAIDKDVTGAVTLTLDQPVPWDQVLDLVLKMNQLGMVYEYDIIRIAKLETLKQEQDLRNEQIEAARKAQEQKKSLEPLLTEYIAVNYSNAKSEVLPHIETILTKERGSVSVDERNNQIIITDTAIKIRQAKELVQRIDKVTPQVIIEARVVEVTSSFSKELGIEWDAAYGPGYDSVFDITGSGDMAMNFPAAGASSSIGFSFSRLSGVPFVLNAKLNALETNGNGRILSAPKILTLDNKKAMIKQGLEFPYLERDDAGGSSVRFKDIDLLLEVTPHVTPDDRISMSIFITKNDVASLTDGVPSIATNEAQTELLVNDGDTLVIGGIIKASQAEGQSGFPLLSRIPLLGWMFKTHNESDQNNELLIFITPRIVQLEQKALAF
ncbi:MAG: type IV pilus secretin PilQ [Desulfosarcinaceae bacterium]|nr:type IV pilus secretin PilQ [Desulfosarcinaceae bacterium]